MQEPKFIKNSSWKYLSEGLFCAILFRVCWRSVTAVVCASILVELGGQWLSSGALLQFNSTWRSLRGSEGTGLFIHQSPIILLKNFYQEALISQDFHTCHMYREFSLTGKTGNCGQGMWARNLQNLLLSMWKGYPRKAKPVTLISEMNKVILLENLIPKAI